MKKLFLATAVFFVAFASYGASFDCEKASTLVEKTICQDPKLSHLDELLTQTYKTALNATKEPAALRSRQKAWRTNVRNKCLDADCLVREHSRRITGLSNIIVAKYPWIYKSHPKLTKAECMAARQHDREYWWGHGKCRLGLLRFGFGVAIRDLVSVYSPGTTYYRTGELVEDIISFEVFEGVYCLRGGPCVPAKDIKLLGSTFVGPWPGERYGSGHNSDTWKRVMSSCELIKADRKNIIAANLHEIMEGCL
jgi:uncharacterized protein YecT (DUF1311 family)